MTTNYHTPLSTTVKIAASGATINAPMGQLDAAIGSANTAIDVVEADLAALDTRVEEAEDALLALTGQMFGRLSLVSGDPYGAGAVIASRIHYTPYMGNTVQIYNPSLSKFVSYSFSALDFYLADLYTTVGIYDLFVFQVSGQVFLGANYRPWSSATARGTGYEIELKNGLYVNTSGMTAIYTTALGGMTNDYALIAANAGTYVGSFYLDDAYEVEMGNDLVGLYNAYNRLPYRQVYGGENEHTYTSDNYRNWNNTEETEVRLLFGLLQESVYHVNVTSLAGKYTGVGVIDKNHSSGVLQGGKYVDSDGEIQVFGRAFIAEALGLTELIARESGMEYGGEFISIETETISWR